jgi:hypothetical protein
VGPATKWAQAFANLKRAPLGPVAFADDVVGGAVNAASASSGGTINPGIHCNIVGNIVRNHHGTPLSSGGASSSTDGLGDGAHFFVDEIKRNVNFHTSAVARTAELAQADALVNAAEEAMGMLSASEASQLRASALPITAPGALTHKRAVDAFREAIDQSQTLLQKSIEPLSGGVQSVRQRVAEIDARGLQNPLFPQDGIQRFTQRFEDVTQHFPRLARNSPAAVRASEMTIPKTLKRHANALWASVNNPSRVTPPTDAQIITMARAARIHHPQLPMTRDALFKGADAARAAARAGMAPERAAQVGINVARDFSAVQTSSSLLKPPSWEQIQAGTAELN